MKRGTLVRVEWQDAVGSSEWHTFDEAARLTPALIKTVGKIVVDADDHLTVAADWGDECVAGLTVIPRGWVVKVERLR